MNTAIGIALGLGLALAGLYPWHWIWWAIVLPVVLAFRLVVPR